MRSYEGLFIFDPALTDSLLESSLKDCVQIIQQQGGKLTDQRLLGKKLLGYSVKKQKSGYVVVVEFELPPDRLKECLRLFCLYEKLLKANIVQKKIRKLPLAKAV